MTRGLRTPLGPLLAIVLVAGRAKDGATRWG